MNFKFAFFPFLICKFEDEELFLGWLALESFSHSRRRNVNPSPVTQFNTIMPILENNFSFLKLLTVTEFNTIVPILGNNFSLF